MRAFLAGLAIAVIGSGCHTSNGPKSAPEISACLDLGGAVASDGFCDVHDTTTTYDIAIRYPSGYPDQEAVAEYLKQSRKNFHRLGRDVTGSRGPP